MFETAIALLAAHVVADFLIQFDWIIKNKRRPGVFLLHTGLVALTAVLALGAFAVKSPAPWVAVAIVTLSHAAIDAMKTYGFKQDWLARRPRWKFVLFSLDQLGHALFILLAAAIAQRAFMDGYWVHLMPGGTGWLLRIFAFAAGFVIATRVGGFAIGIFMERFTLPELETKHGGGSEDQGLRAGGTWIGLLERALSFVFILAGQWAAIGFLLAAKSILRFQYARDRSHSEYVIIGTLASFGWAIGAAFLTRFLIER